MTTDKMTLEQVREVLDGAIASGTEITPALSKLLRTAIDAHLASREVSDEDVERAKAVYHASAERDDCPFPVLIAGLRDVIQADRQRGDGVMIDPTDNECSEDPAIRKAFADGYDTSHAHGLLAQRGQVREGFVLVPVEPTDAMRWAGGEIEVPSNAYHHSDIALDVRCIDVWKAMLAAAPDATLSAKGEVK